MQVPSLFAVLEPSAIIDVYYVTFDLKGKKFILMFMQSSSYDRARNVFARNETNLVSA